MKILVACEYSATVREAFAKRGHEAWSCDLLPTEIPGNHYQGPVEDMLDDDWDLMIAHPPCTYLCVSGIHWNDRGRGWEGTEGALLFVKTLMNAPIGRIAVENPVSIISSRIRKPDQIIQPHQFGHDASKSTCLWLKGLPQLQPTKHVDPTYFCCGRPIDVGLVRKYGCANCGGTKKARPRWGNQTPSGQNKLAPSKDRWKLRSTTYQGIADAMAEQWGCL